MKSRHSHVILTDLLVIGCMIAVVPWIGASDSITNEDRGKRFVRWLASGDYASAWEAFDSTMKAAMPPGQIEETWQTLLVQVGSYERQLGTRLEKWREYELVFVTCEFERYTLDVKVVFDRSGRVAGLWFVPSQSAMEYRAPDYAVPESFLEEEMIIGSDEWALPGTLAIPSVERAVPAVVLVHGSGPQDRDETIGPNKPFRDLAWGLASRGIAVLRYVKRTREHSEKFAALNERFTVKEETIDDALLAVAALRKVERINNEKVFVLGHSLGGMLIPRIGARDREIAGFIVMAGPSRPSEDAILEQMTYIYSLDGFVSDKELEQLDKIKRQVAMVKNPRLSAETPSSELPLGLPAAYWLDLRDYSPAEAAKHLHCDMLILQGGRDYQVTMADFRGWKRALNGRQNVVFKSYPKLNHLFMEGDGKSSPEEYQAAGHVAEVVIEDIASWIKSR